MVKQPRLPTKRMTERQIILSPPDFSLDSAGDRLLHVVLVEPEIPQNTGNVARLCAGSGVWLHLVEPLGYELDDRHLKRAGLDYWPNVRLSVHPSLASLEPLLPRERTHVFTTKTERFNRDARYVRGDVLVYGRESRGLPGDFIARWADRAVRIPITDAVRSLNLSNSVAIGVYEALGQLGWTGA